MGTAAYRACVLKGRARFRRLFDAGRFVRTPAVSLLLLSAPEDRLRMAICVSRKLGNAVQRNRYRRVTREALDELIGDVEHGFYVAVFPREPFLKMAASARKQALQGGLREAGLLEAAP